MSEYLPNPFRSRENIKVEIDLSNYATKADINNITHVDSSNFALKTNLADLKTEVDKLDIDKLVPILADLNKLSNVVKNDVAKKTVYDKLVTKVNEIDTSDFVLKANYNTKITELENKIPDTSNRVKKTDYNTKITELENKISDISNLGTKTALTKVENKIPSISNLVKKTDYDTKITEIKKKFTDHKHDKYIDTSTFNTLATNYFNARIAQSNLITKADFDAKLSSLNRSITANKTRHFLSDNDLSYCHGKNHFDEDGSLNYYVFQLLFKYLEVAHVGNITYILSWKSRGLHDTKIKAIVTTNYLLNPRINIYDMGKIKMKFNGSFLNRFPTTMPHRNIVNIYIVYEITSDYKDINYPTLENCLFGFVKLTKNADIEKYRYFGYGIRFDRQSSFSTGNDTGENVIIFGADMSSSTKIDNRKKDILIYGEGPTQGLKSTLSAEKMYSTNFTKNKTKFCLSLYYNGINSYLFANGKEIIKFKEKHSEIVPYSLCLGKISKDWTNDNLKKKTGFNGYIYDFSTDYNVINKSDILNQIFNEK